MHLRARGTFDLLLVTPISAHGIVWGKCLSQYVHFLHTALTALPFVLVLGVLERVEGRALAALVSAFWVGAIPLFWLPAVWLIAPAIAREREKRTLDVLLSAPLSTPQILWGKVRGCTRRIWTAAVILSAVIPTQLLTAPKPLLLVPLAMMFAVGSATMLAWALFASAVSRTAFRATMLAVGGFVLLVAFGWPFKIVMSLGRKACATASGSWAEYSRRQGQWWKYPAVLADLETVAIHMAALAVVLIVLAWALSKCFYRGESRR